MAVAEENSSEELVRYKVGRFSIDSPKFAPLTSRMEKMRFRRIHEISWPEDVNRESSRSELWRKHYNEISEKRPPFGEQDVVIELRQSLDGFEWAKAIKYYGDPYVKERIFWDVIVDAGDVALLVISRGRADLSDQILHDGLAIAESYVSGDSRVGTAKNPFYLTYGFIDLPLLYSEEIYARFEGDRPKTKIEIVTKITMKEEPSNQNLIARFAASVAAGFAFGLSIDKIREGRRTVAGMEGEEVIMVGGADKDNLELSCMWRFAGKANSGRYPKMTIELEAPNENVDEVIAMWDALLDSIRPVVGP